MAQSRGSSRSRSGSTGKNGASTQMLLIELKQRILAALNKLADRDTQHIAVEDLERIAETLTPEGISLCLSCLYDTDAQQKSAVRKECVKMFGTLASLHDDLLTPHLHKIVANIVRRLRDPDSSVRDVCVDAMGTLAAKVLPPPCSAGDSGGGENGGPAPFSGPLWVFVKPLFDALSEQNRGVQIGAAMCLARVIECVPDPPPGALQRLCPRIIKYLNNPNFAAKAALISAVGSIVQAQGTTSYQCLATIMACVQDALKSADWATRKAASDTLACMASGAGSSLASFKTSVLDALGACRFDKVKPVRDSVVQTLQIWKTIPAFEADTSGPYRMSAVKENAFGESTDFFLPLKKPDAFVKAAPNANNLTSVKPDAFVKASPNLNNLMSVNSPHSALENSSIPDYARSVGNEISNSILKKRTSLSYKKANPDFFRKLDKKDLSDWQVEIAVPRTSKLAVQDIGLDCGVVRPQIPVLVKERKVFPEEASGLGSKSGGGDPDVLAASQEKAESGRPSGKPTHSFHNVGIMIRNQIFEENVGMSSVKCQRSRSKVVKESWLDTHLQQNGEGEIGFDAIGTGPTSTSSGSCSSGGQVAHSGSELAFIRRQLCQIELQQSNLFELLQQFISSSQVSLLDLESRVRGVEKVVEHLAQDLVTGRCEGGTARCCGRLLAGADFLSSKFWKRNEGRGSCQEKSVSSETLPSGARGGRDARHGPLELGTDDQSVQKRVTMEDGDVLHVNRKLKNRGLGLSRLGEGPSGRSIWQASKDEATLTAIRVAGEDARLEAGESVKALAGLARPKIGVSLEGLNQKVGGQAKGHFWCIWNRATEFLKSGDVDSAYVEVLCAGDELLLVRLMGRTGPVMEHLSNGTAVEFLHTIIQLLLRQSFLDVIIPWIQQVADLVASTGPYDPGLPLDGKRQLVAALQEASTSGSLELWICKTIDELALKLANGWGIIV